MHDKLRQMGEYVSTQTLVIHQWTGHFIITTVHRAVGVDDHISNSINTPPPYIHIVHNETSAPSCSRGLSVGQANVCERGKLSVSAHTQPGSTMPLRLFVSTSGVRTCILRSSDLSRLTCYTLLIHSNHEIIRSLIDMLIHSDHEIIRSLTCYISYTQFCVLLKGPGAQDNCSSYTDCMETEYVC